MNQDRFVSAVKENRCFICGTEQGKQIKIINNVYLVEIRQINSLPICNLCYPYYPENYLSLDEDHLRWVILEKRLHQQNMYSKTCKNGCGRTIFTARKEKEFCSANCRSKFWINSKQIK